MWEKQPLTLEMASVDPAGMTLVCYSVKWELRAEVELEPSYSQLQLLMVSGDYVWKSDWLDVSPLLDRVATVQLSQMALKRWHLLTTAHCSMQGNNWTPLELITALFLTLDPVLA